MTSGTARAPDSEPANRSRPVRLITWAAPVLIQLRIMRPRLSAACALRSGGRLAPVPRTTGVVGELEAGGAQVFRGGLIGGGEIADRQGVVAAGFDLAAAEHHGGKIAALELTDDHAVVEGHDVPDVAHQQLSLGDDVAH